MGSGSGTAFGGDEPVNFEKNVPEKKLCMIF